MASITLRRRYKNGLQSDYDPFETESIYLAVNYLSGLLPVTFYLLINGREYDWPGKGFGITNNGVWEHIRYCIELDEAFYGN